MSGEVVEMGAAEVVTVAEKAPKPTFPIEDSTQVDAFLAYLKETLIKSDMTIKVNIRPKKAWAAFSGCFGPGLQGGEVDIPADFTIQGRDNAKKNLTHGDIPFAVKVTDSNGGDVVPKLTDNGDGTYGVSYMPVTAGPHVVNVTLNGEPVGEGTWKPLIDPPTPDPTKCKLLGNGLNSANVAIPALLEVHAYNKIGNPLKVGGHPFKLSVNGPHEAAPSELHDNGDGTYSGKYTPCDTGRHDVAVKLGSANVQGSPCAVMVAKNVAMADAGRSYADGPGVTGGCTTAEPAVFTIHAVAPSGDEMKVGGSPFDTEVRDPEDNPVPVTLVDNKDGTYTGKYQPLKPGPHSVEVILRHHLEPLFYEHIKNSPFKPKILPGIDASKCVAYGPGLENNVLDTLPTEFFVQAKDIVGNNVKEKNLPFTAKVTGPHGEVPCELVDQGNGLYRATYAPDTAGDHTVEIKLEDQPVGKSPYHVEVHKGCDYHNSLIGGYTFIIRTKTKDNQVLKVGGENAFEVGISLKDTGVAVPQDLIHIKDNSDGSYLVTYEIPDNVAEPAQAGTYIVGCRLNGKHIVGSPFEMAFA
ncbi:gelation factor [Pelomyxa schiedti]|nr:gelation factor [Pelomyxa schiedti]